MSVTDDTIDQRVLRRNVLARAFRVIENLEICSQQKDTSNEALGSNALDVSGKQQFITKENHCL